MIPIPNINKFALTGTHSSGKTTLVKALANSELSNKFIFYTERSKYLKETLGVPLNENSQIISQYLFLGERVKELYGLDMISDRSVYDVMAYTLSSNSINGEDKSLFIKGCLPLLKFYSCIFLIDSSEVPIEDNGLRDINPVYRDQIQMTIEDLLQAYPPNNLVKIKGTVEERTSQIISAINKYLY